MHRKFLSPVLLMATAAIVFGTLFTLIKTDIGEYKPLKIPKKDRIDLAWEQEFEMTKDPALGYVPIERLMTAWNYTKQGLMRRGNEAISNIQWTALGSKNFGGRTRALIVDLNDPTRKTVWAGSVGGGIWKTTDITATAPNWAPIDDLFGNLAVSSIAQDPVNPQIMYFGTGEGYGNSDAVRGLGIWKSTNGGTTWSQLPATNTSTYNYNFKVLVSNTGVLFTGTTSGLYRSQNGGNTFTKVLGTGLGISGANSNTCYDIEQAANGDLYATLRGSEGSGLNGSIHKSTNGGLTWGAALPLPTSSDRIEIAVAASNANYIYALVELGSAVQGIYQSTDAGASFSLKTEPDDIDGGISAADFSRGQAWYDLTIGVSPDDPLTIFVGGVDLFKSANGGDSWTQVAHWYGGYSLQEVHADQHGIVFSPGNGSIVYFVNDGAVYRSANANDPMPLIESKGSNYNTLQFYACAMTPTAGAYNFVAGSQDNGSHKFTQNVFANTTEVTGGDGAFCHIDQDQPQYWFTSYVYNNYYRSSNGGNSFSSASFSSSNGRFINPTDYDDAGNMMYCAHSTNNFLRWNNPQTGNSFTVVNVPGLNGHISAVKVSSATLNRVFFGTSNGHVVMVDNAHTATPTATTLNTGAGMPGSYISCVEVEPGNDDHILVTYSSYGVNSIWETTNGGLSWTSVEGNIPDMPVRWVIFNPTNNDQALIATELGVWSTTNLNGTSTNWGASNSGLANVRVDMLQSRSSDRLIIAATHGRGLYYTGAFSPASASFTTSTQIVYPGRALQFTNTSVSATSSAWNFGDGNTSTATNPVKAFTTPGTYNVTLSINGGASTSVRTIIVMPFEGTPYTPAGGGNFDVNPAHFAAETISGTGWQKGNSVVTGKSGTNSGANAWVTGLTGNYVNNSESYLYGPSYNLSSLGTYNFSFYTKYVFEPDFDGIRVEYSLDTGKNWFPLGTSVATNWYNYANPSTTAFPAGQAYFSGTNSSYSKKQYDISFLAGNDQVAFRFAFKSDGGVTAAGAAIDDVAIEGTVNSPLPLNLVSFTAAKDGEDALLRWQTVNELNVSHFEVERSWNGIEFNYIAKQNASNGTINNYSFKDLLSRQSRPGTTVYYRLKMIDRDGKFGYSPVELLRWNGLQNSQVSISPNPFKDHILVNTLLKVEKVQLIDNQGRVVVSANALPGGRLNVPLLPAGTYVLTLYTNEGILSRKLVRQ